MPLPAPKRIYGGLLSSGSIGVIVSFIAVIDEDVRRYLGGLFAGGFASWIPTTMPDLRFQTILRVVSDTTGVSIDARAPVLFFLGVGLVLFVLMFKT
jgi:hypothetical protein